MTEPQLQGASVEAAMPRHSGPTSRILPETDPSIPEQYDLLLRKLTLAEEELEAANSSGRSGNLEEASGIVFDLLYSLDFKHGGELVPRLAALYGYIGNELLNVARTRDRAQLGHLKDMIATLKQSWCS